MRAAVGTWLLWLAILGALLAPTPGTAQTSSRPRWLPRLGIFRKTMPQTGAKDTPPTISTTQEDTQKETLPTPRVTLGQPQTFGKVLTLPKLIEQSLMHHPKLAQAHFAIDAAAGRAWQAGLYPNPNVAAIWDELGDVQGTGGINTIPQITQEIVTAGKLRLDRCVANGETALAQLALQRQRMELITEVRKAFFRVLALQKRIDVLQELVELASETHEKAKALKEAKQIAELDVINFRIEQNRFTIQLQAARQQHLAAWRRLVTVAGLPKLHAMPVAGAFEIVGPHCNFVAAGKTVLHRHPDVAAAHVRISRAELALQRAKVEKIPNVTVGGGFVRQNQNGSDDWMVQFSLPVPLFDRNQGTVHAAAAELGKAHHEVKRVHYELLNRLARAHGQYSTARGRAQQFRDTILTDAERAYELSLVAYKSGQFDYLKVLTAQRIAAQARLEYVEALAEAWQSACDIAGLLQDEHWPVLRK